MGKIVQDLATGKEGEQAVIQMLSRHGIPGEPNTNRKEFSYYDIKAKISRKPFTIEVKNDKYAARSGNIAIEIYNPKSEKLSGLTATKSDIWVHIVNEEYWFTATSLLKSFINIHKPKRIIDRAGDGNATIYLYEATLILPAIFICMNDKGKKDFEAELKELLKHNGV